MNQMETETVEFPCPTCGKLFAVDPLNPPERRARKLRQNDPTKFKNMALRNKVINLLHKEHGWSYGQISDALHVCEKTVADFMLK